MTELTLHEEIEVDFDPDDREMDQIRMVGYSDITGIIDLYLVVNDETEYHLTDCYAYTFDPSEGVYHAVGEIYEITAENPIHTAQEIEVTIDGKAEKLPANTPLWMLRTDGESYAELQTEDGSVCRIDFTHEGYRSFIGGIPEEECFSDLPIAEIPWMKTNRCRIVSSEPMD